LTNQDIDKSSPRCVRFKTNRNPFNPLEPKYNLPKCEEYPLQEQRFIRDSIQINDIDGARPKKYLLWKTRDKISCHDIKGTTTKLKKIRTTKYSNIDYNDVTQFKFKTNRHINPLDPEYKINYKDGEKA